MMTGTMTGTELSILVEVKEVLEKREFHNIVYIDAIDFATKYKALAYYGNSKEAYSITVDLLKKDCEVDFQVA